MERPPATLAGVDELEIKSQSLLFHDVRSYAVGHGCAVAWSGDVPDEVSTTYLPRHELLLSEATGGDDLDLSMTRLAADETFDVLEELISRYRVWIEGLPQAAGQALDDEDTETLDGTWATPRRSRTGWRRAFVCSAPTRTSDAPSG